MNKSLKKTILKPLILGTFFLILINGTIISTHQTSGLVGFTLTFTTPTFANHDGTYTITARTSQSVDCIQIYEDGTLLTEKTGSSILSISHTFSNLKKIRFTALAEKQGYIRISNKITRVRFNIADPEPTFTPGNLGTDWGRHPDDYIVYDEADRILQQKYGNSRPSDKYSIVNILWQYVKDNWVHKGAVIKPDKDIITSKYEGACYSASILLSGLYRSIGLPSRILLLNFEADDTEHAFLEVYIGGTEHDGWIPACADWSQGGWFNWGKQTSSRFNYRVENVHKWEWDASNQILNLEKVTWVYNVLGSVTDAHGNWIGFKGLKHQKVDLNDPNWLTWDDYKLAFDYA